jgi:hypothetical protein
MESKNRVSRLCLAVVIFVSVVAAVGLAELELMLSKPQPVVQPTLPTEEQPAIDKPSSPAAPKVDEIPGRQFNVRHRECSPIRRG